MTEDWAEKTADEITLGLLYDGAEQPRKGSSISERFAKALRQAKEEGWEERLAEVLDLIENKGSAIQAYRPMINIELLEVIRSLGAESGKHE